MYYLGISDPGALDDHIWAQRYHQLIHIRKQESGT